MTEQHTPSPRSRLQALLAIPDNQRTEEQWDELHELEITLAPGNRIGHQDTPGRPAGKSGGDGPRNGPPKGGPRGESRGDSRNGRSGRSGQPRPANPPPQNADDSVPAEGGSEVGADGSPSKKPFRRFHKRPPKPAAT